MPNMVIERIHMRKKVVLTEELKCIRDKYCEWGEISVMDEAINAIMPKNQNPILLNDLIELLQKLQKNSDNDTVVYFTDDDSDDGDLELTPLHINKCFKSKFGNYIVFR